jgi:pSer/pThr/pTyr-binding forkhead associated (FHA) protein
MTTPVLTFLVQEPGVEPRRVTTEEPIVKIGRGARLQLELTNPAVSRMHAVVEITDRGAQLIDLGSEPPTAVNGARVNQHVLAAGDRIQIGDSVILVEAIGASGVLANAAPRSDVGTAVTRDPSGAGAWNWGDSPKPRRERRVVGPAMLLVLLLLGVLGFLALR